MAETPRERRTEDEDASWQRRYADARKAWPSVHVDLAEFRAFVVQRWTELTDESEVAFSDLYLTCGCSLARSAAFVAFEQAYRAEIDAVVKRLGPLAPPVDDARQLIHERILTGPKPKILEFRGRGSLKSWVRVVALRALLNHRQRIDERVPVDDDSDIERLLPASDDPELELMRRHYAEEVRATLRECIAQLDARERTLLRLAFIEGATVDAIGALYAVHRATAARWVQSAHRVLTTRVHRRLRERLRIDSDELESVLRLLSSAFDTSLSRYLE